jgi:hypothetical protein
MIRYLILATALVLSVPDLAQQASAQVVSTFGGLPASGPGVPCDGGTGSQVNSVGTTVETVCAAPGAGAGRFFFQVKGSASAASSGYCTWDGLTPSATHDNFMIGAEQGYDSTGMSAVPNGPIQCVASSGTIPITTSVIQSGSAP